MGYVTLSIEGLSASFYNQKNDVWNVIFPCDSKDHTVDFYFWKNGSLKTSERVPLNSKNIYITTENAIPPRVHSEPSFEMVIDLTSNELHKEGLKFATNLPAGREKSIMTVADACFSAAETKRRRNYIFDPNGTIKPIGSDYASIVGASIQLKENGKVIMKVEGLDQPPFEFGDGDKLYFDNDCSKCTLLSHINDFQYYQDIFENARFKDLEFVMLSFPLSTKEIEEADLERFRKLIPFGPAPLFCDGMRISKSDDLQ